MFADNNRVLSRLKVLCTLGGGHRGVVNHDGEVLEWTWLAREEYKLLLVKVELVVVS